MKFSLALFGWLVLPALAPGQDNTKREMEKNGFRLEAEHTFLPYQYFLVFKVK